MPAESWRRDPRLGVAVIVLGATLAAFVALAVAIMLMPAFVTLDDRLSQAVRQLAFPGIHSMALFLTRLGDFLPMGVLTAVTGAVLWLRGRKAEAVLLVLSVALGTLLGEGLKVLIHRVRPALEYARIAPPETYSFPSGHALTSLVYFGTLAFVVLLDVESLKRSALAVLACVLLAIAIAMSRVYLGVHYVGDVVGGWLLGSAWIAFMALVGASWGAGNAPQKGR